MNDDGDLEGLRALVTGVTVQDCALCSASMDR